MVTRSEAAAMTRQSLLDAAGALLDSGGPDAVTLREVGAVAGVSRSAPYRHFANKGTLLTAVATNAMNDLGDTLEGLAAGNDPPQQALRAALLALLAIGRTRPHVYRLMFTTPAGDPTAASRAAERTQDLFLDLVGRIVGRRRARHYGALLLTTAHGATSFESSGHFVWDKWQTNAEQLIDSMIALLPAKK
ncbi:MAG TPA: TetR/AcrR family transcriptional regulator [Mycobacterium sp.]|nr:TetR/AcrR family transcriptional regulator [Mycobacterium sp.]HUB56868.1 TetR/AcrR family transcriptional regulator [Mycobacterium sp.]